MTETTPTGARGKTGRVRLDVRDERLHDLVSSDAELECLATGFNFIEGPVWSPVGECLVFSDVKGNARYRWNADGVEQIAAPTHHGNGMTLDALGRLIVCEHDTSCVARMDANGSGYGREVIADQYDGHELNSPNDVVVHSDGSVFFTDPPYGRLPAVGIEREQDLDFQGVFRATATGLELVAGDFDRPNGLCFCPDESLLYVNDTARGHIRVFDVLADGGSFGSGRVFAEGISGDTGAVDGMKCDERGNVWVTGPGGVWVLDPRGIVLGVVLTPERVGNFHWGGPDWSWLFLAASTSLYRLPAGVSGRHEPFMR
jgi:gluconolactonase